jgi:hypothetical protein
MTPERDAGQVYVALSRVRSLESLCVKSFLVQKVQAHPRVIDFYARFEPGLKARIAAVAAEAVAALSNSPATSQAVARIPNGPSMSQGSKLTEEQRALMERKRLQALAIRAARSGAPLPDGVSVAMSQAAPPLSLPSRPPGASPPAVALSAPAAVAPASPGRVSLPASQEGTAGPTSRVAEPGAPQGMSVGKEPRAAPSAAASNGKEEADAPGDVDCGFVVRCRRHDVPCRSVRRRVEGPVQCVHMECESGCLVELRVHVPHTL